MSTERQLDRAEQDCFSVNTFFLLYFTLVNPRLRHPLILGTNWPAFKILLGVLCVDASCGKEKPEGEAAVRMGEAEPGPAEVAPGERSAVERLILTERDDFPLEQSQDESCFSRRLIVILWQGIWVKQRH